MKNKRIAIYTRVSTDQQSVDMQLMHLRELAGLRKGDIYKEFIDHDVSSAKKYRPALEELMADARKRKFDTVLVYRFDRFARSSKELLIALEEFRSLEIDFISYHENIDTSSPLGKAMFTIVAAMAELERNIIVERVKSGLKSAKQKGIILGRPKVEVDNKQIQQLKLEGLSLRAIANKTGVSKSTVAKYLN
jgi:DNA invertase Pin-like site-specific DNA recombinase